jgi:hypothetical protein
MISITCTNKLILGEFERAEIFLIDFDFIFWLLVKFTIIPLPQIFYCFLLRVLGGDKILSNRK